MYRHRSWLIVEGWDDAAFFESLIGRLFRINFNRREKSISYSDKINIVISQGKGQVKEVMRAYINVEIARKVGIALDINDKSPQEVENKVRDDVASQFKSPVKVDKGIILVPQESKVIAIPMGLYNDEEIKSLGITKYAMEDYLLKLALRQSPKDLKELLSLLKDMHLQRSKEFLQPLKALFKFSDDDRAFARFLIGRSDNTTIDELKKDMKDVIDKVKILIQGDNQ